MLAWLILVVILPGNTSDLLVPADFIAILHIVSMPSSILFIFLSIHLRSDRPADAIMQSRLFRLMGCLEILKQMLVILRLVCVSV